MSRSLAQIKEQIAIPLEGFAIAHFPVLLNARSGHSLDNLLGSDKLGFFIQYKPQAIRIDSPTGLLSQINCYFLRELSVSVSAAFGYAAAINQQLVNSTVFVVQDIDGDSGYYLRMDTLLKRCYEAEDGEPKDVSIFLASVSQDIERLSRFFRDFVPA